MFCFQCEQTANGKACSGASGVCGKSGITARAQDDLTGALISLAKSGSKDYDLFIKGLFATVTNVNFSPDKIKALTLRSGTEPYDMGRVWTDDEDIRSLKSLILFGLRGMSAYAYHAGALGYHDDEVNSFFVKGLASIGSDMTMNELLPLVLEAGSANFQCMALLDKANTQTYGTPSPVKVSRTINRGPFIVITGHDLRDLELLLRQTAGRGINVYTHGEMLPAHSYPELRKYPHLKGNFGTAWQNQQKEFDSIPGALLFTTNCLMPPKASYIDRVFTSGPVEFDGVRHIDDSKDFSPVISKSLELGGYDSDIEGGTFTTGFGHGAVLGVADRVIELVKSGKIRHFFLVGGCDGARAGRNYYTELASQIPSDCVILTLACGKYRFNDLEFGDIEGIPRLLDMGQCNDAYGAVRVALALSEALGCGVNDLPLSLILSWYEQKAVCILLSLLSLGIKNIRLGPTLPAFVSGNVLKYLAENFGIAPVSSPGDDLKAILG